MQVEVALRAKWGRSVALRMGEIAMVAACLSRPDNVSVQLDDTADPALNLMDEHQHHIRHLPVLHGEALVGVIGIGDILSLAAPVWSLADEAARALVRA